MIADVGISKIPEDYTQDRKVTNNKYGTEWYDPPEFARLEDKVSQSERLGMISRRYDTWGLGCIFLDFVVWILYGVDD